MSDLRTHPTLSRTLSLVAAQTLAQHAGPTLLRRPSSSPHQGGILELLRRPHAPLVVGTAAVRHGLCRAKDLRLLVAWQSARRYSSSNNNAQLRRELMRELLDAYVESRPTQLEGVDGACGGGGQLP